MKYYIMNTDDTHKNPNFYKKWILENFAYASGYFRSKGVLEKLEKGDLIFCYQKQKGIIAIGKILDKWDGKSHKDHEFYVGRSKEEKNNVYRIKVNWYLDLTQCPIKYSETKKFGNLSFKNTISQIRDEFLAEEILKLGKQKSIL
ncbi:MAG: EVE domain-containing protein [Candidatus Lokiarchaeota archaeon]|nr:EVE domain-containing protein [Candidatus Lokiarchaeota archaeon]